ncbi:MAG: phosphoribosylanthranilate isomerase [Deltaproteobacteria bacterium]|jgi:phosphoribosylanthranilate isomerase|nr:phosphoribosylanthranilate isomerase [Deltaproteobacteria bacterium]
MLKVKICGITNYDDAVVAANLGADALGFIFAPKSPRKIEPAIAAEIIKELPPFIKTVGVFVNEHIDKIKDIVDYCGLDSIQLHGDETPEICEALMPRAIKAVRVRDDFDTSRLLSYRGKIRAFLLDTYSEKAAGGTGKTFNWDKALEINSIGIPVILAGGLTPSNITKAIKKVRPYGVDINSGIEKGPGVKDHEAMKELFQKIRKEERG